MWLGLQLTHAPDWHTYWKNSGDSGLPTELEWTLPPGVTAGAIAWPTPRKFPLGTLANYGYDGTVLLPVPLTIDPTFTGQAIEVKLYAAWLVCRKECIPEEGNFTLRLPVQGSTAINGIAFEAACAAAPSDQPAADSAVSQRTAARCLTRRPARCLAWPDAGVFSGNARPDRARRRLDPVLGRRALDRQRAALAAPQ